ncbi:MAG TPA: hypothetical protein VHF06_29985 [Pseudonocardiaceae bacterium]|jgi:hypothetical protein|nr:hypothetical protein [Pseudonocardiaceae bacterium]
MSETDLPIPDYDRLTAGDLDHRVRSLAREQLQELLDHERRNAARVHVITVLEERMDELESGELPTSDDGSNVPRRS